MKLPKEPLLAFLSIAAIIGGIVILMATPYDGYFSDNEGQAALGVILLAADLLAFR